MEVVNTSVKIHHSSERTNSGIHGPPVLVPPVVPRPQQVLPPPVAGHLIEDPAALQHMKGVDFTEVEAVLKREAVICDLRHLSSEVISLIDPHSVSARVLGGQTERKSKSTRPERN